MDEIWKDIPNYENIYQVSNLGIVKSLGNDKSKKEKILSRLINSGGYYQVSLYSNGNSKMIHVHQLVAICFLNHAPQKKKLVVNHIDGNKLNNSVENLEIVSCRDNVSVCFRRLKKEKTSKMIGVSWNKGVEKWRSQIRINNKIKHIGYFVTESEASNAYQKELKKITNK